MPREPFPGERGIFLCPAPRFPQKSYGAVLALNASKRIDGDTSRECFPPGDTAVDMSYTNFRAEPLRARALLLA